MLALKETLQADAFRYSGCAGRKAMLTSYLRHPGFRFTWHLRHVAALLPRRRSLAAPAYLYHRFWLNHYRFRYGFDVSPSTLIGPGFYQGHFGGVVVSPDAVLGANVNLAHGVTIGATSRGARIGAPTLGDRVWVGAHAILVGKIVIGSEALIAPGAYVNFDVPSRAVVLGNPGRVVSDSGSDGYINHVLPPGEAKGEA